MKKQYRPENLSGMRIKRRNAGNDKRLNFSIQNWQMIVSPSTICPHNTIHLNLYLLHYIALPRCFQSLSDTSKMISSYTVPSYLFHHHFCLHKCTHIVFLICSRCTDNIDTSPGCVSHNFHAILNCFPTCIR